MHDVFYLHGFKQREKLEESALPYLFYLAAPLPQRNTGLERTAFVPLVTHDGPELLEQGLWPPWSLSSKSPLKGDQCVEGSTGSDRLPSEVHPVHTRLH